MMNGSVPKFTARLALDVLESMEAGGEWSSQQGGAEDVRVLLDQAGALDAPACLDSIFDPACVKLDILQTVPAAFGVGNVQQRVLFYWSTPTDGICPSCGKRVHRVQQGNRSGWHCNHCNTGTIEL